METSDIRQRTQEFKEQAQETGQQLKDKAQDWAQKASSTARDFGNQAQDYMSDNPWSTAALIGVFAFALGYLLGSRR